MGQFVRISHHKPLLRHGRNLKRVLTACRTVKCFLQEHHASVAPVQRGHVACWFAEEGFLRISALPRPTLNKAGTSACGEQSKRRKVSFLVPLIRDSSHHKPPSSPISSLFSFSRFLCFTSISTIQHNQLVPLHLPPSRSRRLSLLVNTNHEHHFTVFRHLRNATSRIAARSSGT